MSAILRQILSLSPLGYWTITGVQSATDGWKNRGSAVSADLSGSPGSVIRQPFGTVIDVTSEATGLTAGTTVGFTSGSWSVCLFAYAPSLTGAGAEAMLQKDANTSFPSEWFIGLDSTSKYQAFIGNTGGGTYHGAYGGSMPVMPTGRWVHLGYVFDSTVPSSKFYEDGIQIFSSTVAVSGSLNTNTRTLGVGRYGSGVSSSAYYFRGSLAHIACFNSVLTAEQIKSIYLAGIRSGVVY